jgi:hypothetical protein
MAYDPRKDTEQTFQQDTGLPGSALPAGQGYIKRPNDMIDVPQQGGMVDTYYPSTTGGKLDMQSKQVPTAQDVPAQDAFQSLNTLNKVYDIEIERKYHEDMATAGVVFGKRGQVDPNSPIDPYLMGVAQANHNKNTVLKEAWYQNYQNKFKLIKADDRATTAEKDNAMKAQLDRNQDPIPIFSMEQAVKEKGGMNPQQLKMRLGRFKNMLYGYGDNFPTDRESAELAAGNVFGVDWDTMPDVVNMLDQKYPQSGTASAQPGLPAGKKSTKTAGKKIVKFVDPNGISWDMPADKVEEALRAMPGSKVQ